MIEANMPSVYWWGMSASLSVWGSADFSEAKPHLMAGVVGSDVNFNVTSVLAKLLLIFLFCWSTQESEVKLDSN